MELLEGTQDLSPPIRRSLLRIACTRIQDIRKSGLHRAVPFATLIRLAQIFPDIKPGSQKESAKELEVVWVESMSIRRISAYFRLCWWNCRFKTVSLKILGNRPLAEFELY